MKSTLVTCTLLMARSLALAAEASFTLTDVDENGIGAAVGSVRRRRG